MINQRLYQRYKRAWNEARFLFNQRSSQEKEALSQLASQRLAKALVLNNLFEGMEENPCMDCGRCCTASGGSAGFHTHSERQMLLSVGIDSLDEYIVDKEHDDAQACIFLAEDGCSIPPHLRSNTCLSYVCYDLLGPQLKKEGLENEYRKLSGGLLCIGGRYYELLSSPPFPEYTQNFGSG